EDEDCVQCSSAETCVQCMQTLDCGWCYNSLNPTLGACIRGLYSGPRRGDCSEYVSPIIDRLYNESLTPTPSPGEPTGPTDLEAKPPQPRPIFDPAVRTTGYSYTACPDLDECFLQLHKCHQLATCTNTEGSYNCTCKQGFKGDGFNTCERTCNVTCVHGRCSNAPHYACECNLGWTGVDCSIDCGCHNHSTCSGGIGKCDSCQDNTHGTLCQLCKGKTWGNATTPDGCKLCACNGHGDDSMGTCHRETGQCYCKDNTRGRYCELCEEGYYGNPAKGGHCYTECRPRNIIYGATTGHIGAQRYATPLQQHSLAARLASVGGQLSGDFAKPSYLLTDSGGETDKIGNETETCLWIITPYKTIAPPPEDAVGTHVILFTLEDLHVPCGTSTLLVYDGMPEVVSRNPAWDRRNHALAAYCSEHSGVFKRPAGDAGDAGAAVVEARSGYLTVLLQRRA
ncbi:EGF domain, partial [Trinorchestia longiramus]